MKITFTLLIGILLGLAVDKALAHQLSPCYRVLTYVDGEPAEEPIRYAGYFCALVMTRQERNAVHEHLTAATIREYRYPPTERPAASDWKWQYMMEAPWTTSARVHQSFAIIFGTWWNDDPLMLALGQSGDFVKGGYKIWTAFKDGHDRYSGARTGCGVNADIHLGRASHLGGLQHLHFMTTETSTDPDQRRARVERTTADALTWMEFAYQVATGELSPNAPLTFERERQLGLPSIALNHCVEPANVKVRTLFSRQGQTVAERNRRTPDVALGSMLHILQDSFSPSHTCRVGRQIDGKRVALLHDIENYLLQDKRAHAELDQYPQWFLDYLWTDQHAYSNDPVVLGAWLISAVDRKLPWGDVEAHLRATIFAQAPIAESETEKCIER